MYTRRKNFMPHLWARSEQDLFAWSLLAALILFFLLARPFFAGNLYMAGDLGDFHLPARAFYAEQLAHGQSFDWMPGIFSGFYLTGEGGAATYHPLHYVLYRWLPFSAALGWEYLSSYPLMLFGMFVFLRRRLGRRDAAMMGSLAFTFSSFNLLHFVHPNAVAAVAHIPWLLAMIDIVLVDARRWKVALAQAMLALLTGSQLLLGCPQFVWFSLLAETVYAVYLVTTRRFAPREGCEEMATCRVCIGCRRNSAALVVIGKGIGLLIGAVQLLPTLEALTESTRHPGVGEAAASTVLHPINLVQLVAPYLPVDRALGDSPRDLSLYIGAVPLMLVLWVFIRRRELGPMRRLARVAAWLAIAALVLALGNQGRWLRLADYVPWAAWFQNSCRYTVLFQLAVAILAAIGFVLLEREARENNKLDRHVPLEQGESRAAALWHQYEVLGATVLISLAVAIAGLILQSGRVVAPAPRVLIGPMLMISAALLVVAASHGIRGALVGLILFTAADLGYYGLSCTFDGPADDLYRACATAAIPPESCQTASSHCAERVFAPPDYGQHQSAPIGNEMTLFGWQRTDGYAALEPRKRLDYFHLPALRVASTRWVHRSPSTSVIVGLKARDENWYEVPDPLPAVRLVSRVIGSASPADDLPRIDVTREALCDYELALPPGSPGTANVVLDQPGRMEIKVRCASPQLLVVAESFHKGWKCMVDGNPRPVYRVNGDFLGCVIEPGNAEVRLEFQPDSLYRGWLAALAGFGLIGFSLIRGMARHELGLVEKIGHSRHGGE